MGARDTHTLHLLRHAKSSWEDQTLADDERPLAPRGIRDARRLARHLSGLGIEAGLVLCSSAVRARQTLDLLKPSLGGTPVLIEEALYAAPAAALLERLQTLPESVGSVVLIGHNPGMQEVALKLASGGEKLDQLAAKFPTCALATLAVPAAAWRDLRSGAAQLTGYTTPRELRTRT